MGGDDLHELGPLALALGLRELDTCRGRLIGGQRWPGRDQDSQGNQVDANVQWPHEGVLLLLIEIRDGWEP